MSILRGLMTRTTEYLNNKTFETLIVKFQITKDERIKYKSLMEEDKKEEGSKKTTENETNFYKFDFEFQEIQKNLAMAFLTLSQNIVRYAKFKLIDQDDAVQEGVMICFEKINRFDPKKGKAFNYMTTCILNHFRQIYRTARNYNELKRKYLEFVKVKTNYNTLKTRTKNKKYNSND